MNVANFCKDGRGFTLVEVLIAAVILVAVVIPLMASFINATRWTAEAQALLTAANLAQGKLEEAKNKPYVEVQNEPADSGQPPVPFADYPGYTCRITVSEYTGNDPDIRGHLKTVTATVYYETLGGQKTVSLTMDKGDR
ncbi:MAG: type II secretion system GspH family protein [Armatimonadetes bacterium]|nr:type II secretion system GspH family protein [Armatimonadota bacterium]